MFINFSNHPSSKWSESQKRAAQIWGAIVDYPFPQVAPESDENEIQSMAEKVVKDMMQKKPDAVMCQGEFTLSYAVVKRLREKKIQVFSACSERRVKEEILSDGTIRKVSEFEFVRFRRYE